MFSIDNYEVPEETAKEMRGLGYQISRIDKSDKPVTETEVQKAIKALCRSINCFSGLDIPESLQNFYAPVLNDKAAGQEVYTTLEHIPYLQAVVLEVGGKKTTKNDKEFFQLKCRSEEYGEMSIYLWKEFVYLQRLLWPYARINLTHLEKKVYNFGGTTTEGETETEFVYATTSDTLIVLDPDFLVDVTKITSACIMSGTNPIMYLAKKFAVTLTNYHLLKGNIVNSYLDISLSGEKTSTLALFKELMRTKPTYCLSFNNDDFRKLKDEAVLHYATLDNEYVQSYRQHNLFIEPTFLSDKYGIRGRLDVLVEYKDEPHRHDVIELKTSKDPMPYTAVRPEHGKQAIAYNLLLDTIDEKQKGSSTILYSSVESSQNPLRNVPNTAHNKREVLRLRNTIVAYEYHLTQNTEKVLSYIDTRKFKNQKLWPNDEVLIAQFQNFFSRASDLERAYFCAFVRFTAMEHRAAKLGANNERGDEGFSALWNQSLAFKERNYTILAYLKYDKTEQDHIGTRVHFKRTEQTIPISRFRVGDFVLVYPQEEDGRLHPTKYQVVKAAIKALNNEEVVISPMGKQIDDVFFKRHTQWALEAESTDTGYDAMYQSLYYFLQSRQHKKDLLLGLAEPGFGEQPEVYNPNLKSKQIELLKKALAAKDYFLLQGPPGTGKTKVMLREIVIHLLKDPNQRILLMAYTNRAVDEICEAIKSIGDVPRFFRLGYGSSTRHEDILLSRYAKEVKLRDLRREVIDCRIFITTVLTYQRNPELQNFLESQLPAECKVTAIVDEASQLLEPQIVGAISGLDSFILIGDEKQLPAVVIQRQSTLETKEELLQDLGIRKMSNSLFERLYRRCVEKGWHQAYGMLEDQGRMHEEIATFPNIAFYKGLLKSITTEQQNRLPDYLQNNPLLENIDNTSLLQLLKEKRTLFFSSQAEKERNRNIQEAEFVYYLVSELSKLFPPEELKDAIGIITPYRTQIASIRSLLNQNEALSPIVVDTVERYQGGQKRIIIVSLAVNNMVQLDTLQVLNEEGNVDRKLNVTLTRAKDHLIIAGCTDVLQHSPVYNGLIEFYMEQDAVLSMGEVM